MSVFSYDPFNAILIIKGYRVTKFADGDFLTIEHDGDLVTPHHGATGSGYVKNKDKGGKIKFVVMGDSYDNDMLSEMLLTQKLLPGGGPAFESSFSEILGTTAVAAHRCRFSKEPEVKRGTDYPKVEWEIVCLEMDANVGSLL